MRGILRDAISGHQQGRLTCELEAPVTVGELIFRLGLPPGAVALAAVGGDRVDFEHLLRDGDCLLLLPAAAGG